MRRYLLCIVIAKLPYGTKSDLHHYHTLRFLPAPAPGRRHRLRLRSTQSLKLIGTTDNAALFVVDNDLDDLLGSLDGVGLVVHPFELFQGSTLRLDTDRQLASQSESQDLPEEVPHERFEAIPTDKDVDVLVAQVLQPDRSRKLVDESNSVDDDSRRSETLGPHGSLQSFRRDDPLQGGVGEGKDNVEEEVCGKCALSDRGDDVGALFGKERR